MFLLSIKKINYLLNSIAEFVLIFMMLLTMADVVLRIFGRPIVGTYELVAMTGAIVIGFAVPQTSWDRGHVFVDFLIEHRTPAVRNIVFIITRIIGIIIISLLSYNLFKKGASLQKAGEITGTLHIPCFYAAYALAFCFFIESLTLVTDIFKLFITEEQK
ncbi:MAG: TRAP transporter small permease subunit [Spirochaetota bacterium]